MDTGLTSNVVLALAIDPSTPSSLYAGTSRGVFKSPDGGRNWGAINTGMTVTSTSGVSALAVDPSAPATLYAGTHENGAFKSTNAGERWTNTALAAKRVFALAIDRSAPSALYAGTGEGGVFGSLDAGSRWTTINTGLTNIDVRALAIDPASPAATLHAGTNGGGVFDCRCDIALRVPATPRPVEPRH